MEFGPTSMDKHGKIQAFYKIEKARNMPRGLRMAMKSKPILITVRAIAGGGKTIKVLKPICR